MTGHLLLVGGWTRLYAKAKAVGHRLTVITAVSTLSEQDGELIDRHVNLDMSDPTAPEVAEALHREDPFDHVVCMREMGLDNAALIVDRLGIGGNPRRPAELTRNKLALRRHLAAAGLSRLPYLGGPDRTTLRAFGDEHGWPVMLKGVKGYGSAETTLVTGPDDIDRAFTKIGHDDLIAEAYASGPEFSVETFSWHGEHTLLAITEKDTTGPPSFVEVGHTVPARLAPARHQEIAELTLALLDSVGHRIGPAHTEVILAPTGPVVVESQTRAGGAFIYDLTDFVTGVDVFTELFRGLAGESPMVAPKQDGVATTRYLTFSSGTVRGIDGVAAAAALPGVVRCSVDVRVGQRIDAPTSSFDRHGYVVVRGDTRDQVEAIVAEATAMLKVVVEQ